MTRIPRLVIAAASSGSGKTTVATGLMSALRARGLNVSGHKVGPDYIDPSYHALATGRPARNLDPVLCGEDLVAPLFAHGAEGADVAVVEGVMGLFDGRGHTDAGSTAHVARLLEAPVVLVVDSRGQGRSVAALVLGFAAFDPRLNVGGVILNQVGTPRHESLLRESLAGIGIPVLGALRRDDSVFTPSRHLGLVPAAERSADAVRAVEALGASVGAAVDLDAVLALARTAPAVTAEPWRAPLQDRARRPVVAVAGGRAFTFGYAENAELLAAAGADVVTVDPLRDEHLPDGCAGLVIGGGFPEVHAAELHANERLRLEIAALARSGAPVAAECAGLLYLVRELDGFEMCGVLDAKARMTSRLTLGYRSAVAATDSVLASRGSVVQGHEFHRTVVEPASELPAWRWDGHSEGFVRRGVHASYLHLHWAGTPSFPLRLVDATQRARAR